jgi:hypothetical protein
MSKKVLTLEYEEEFDFLLLGIFSHQRDFQVCHEINLQLSADLERQDEFTLQLEKKGSTGLFTVFQYKTENEEEYFLISNKGVNGHFISSQKHIDFFLLIRNQNRYTIIEEIIKNLRRSKIISSVIQMEPNTIKTADNFLFVEYIDLAAKREREAKEVLKKL